MLREMFPGFDTIKTSYQSKAQYVANIGGPNPSALADIIFLRKVVIISVIVSLCIFTILFLFINRPYCKYFCHGSVEAGALSFAKVFKLKRDPALCINCHKCEKVCPMIEAILIIDGSKSNP
ncbi:4Fe-4S binding protein [Clostridium thailandense]|uniref:4Fe-4S binding protein n=1 Tax=Clostridium thailandense TaxID=2794346 RepID=UPI003989151C